MNSFVENIAVAARSGMLDHIAVFGYASPDGPFRKNDMLSAERCNAVAEYISRETGIPLNSINIYPGGVAWDGLRTLVIEDTGTLARDTVLCILNRYVPEACTNQTLSDQCRTRLRAIDEGRAYKWMLDNLFPKLRYASAVYTYSAADSSAINLIGEATPVATEPTSSADEADADAISSADYPTLSADSIPEEDTSIAPIDTIPSPTEKYKPLHRLAVKTNLLYYAVLVPNLEIEWRINDNWSVALEGAFASVGKYESSLAYRLSMLSPEVKRWIRPRAPWHGFYVGLFAGGGLYDYEKRTRGYRGEGVMGGLSVGYMWPLSRCLSMEAAVGAGYLYTRYKEYKPIEGHHVYQRTKDLNYFGPLKVKLSLVWRLWDINKPGHKSDKTVVRYE